MALVFFVFNIRENPCHPWLGKPALNAIPGKQDSSNHPNKNAIHFAKIKRIGAASRTAGILGETVALRLRQIFCFWGNLIVYSVPLPTSLATLISPLCFWMML